jgi:uncharacterized protein with GYD domain
MAKYLIEASYTQEGIHGLMQDGGSTRSAEVREIVRDLGGTVDAFYFAFGTADAYVIVDLPTPSSAVAFSLSLSKVGAVGVKTHVLVTQEEVDAASGRSAEPWGAPPQPVGPRRAAL